MCAHNMQNTGILQWCFRRLIPTVTDECGYAYTHTTGTDTVQKTTAYIQ